MFTMFSMDHRLPILKEESTLFYAERLLYVPISKKIYNFMTSLQMQKNKL